MERPRMMNVGSKRQLYKLKLERYIDGLEAENAKLRELVRDMFRDFANADYELKRNHGRTFMAVTRYGPRIRELGIKEVKE